MKPDSATLKSAAAALVGRTTMAQGLPVTITDMAALAKVAAAIVVRNGNGAPKGAGTDSYLLATTSPQGGRRGSS